MARVHTVAKRRVGKRGEYSLRCHRCGLEIEYGQPYKWFKLKQAWGGIKRAYHPTCPILPSDRTTSALGRVWDAQASLDLYSCESVDDLQAALGDLASTVREVSEEYAEKVENMEQGFGHRTYQAEELAERAEALEGWADELEAWEPDSEEPVRGDDQADEDWEADLDSYLEAIRSEAQDAADNCPV